MSGRTLEIVMSLWAVWGLAHGLKALRHWKAREDMTLSFWQGGLINQGKVVRGASLCVLGWSNVALVVAMGLWIGDAVPFNVGQVVALALLVPGLVITMTAKRPSIDAPERPDLPRAIVPKRDAADQGSDDVSAR